MAIDVRSVNDLEPDAPLGESLRTLALVELGMVGPDAGALGTVPSNLLEAALREIQQTVRADDRASAVSKSQIAVTFGPDAGAVSAQSLGERLAEAVGRGLNGTVHNSGQAREQGPRRSGGVHGSSEATERGAPRLDGPAHPSPVVTIDRLLGGGTPPVDVTEGHLRHEADARRADLPTSAPAPLLRHRTIVRVCADHVEDGDRGDTEDDRGDADLTINGRTTDVSSAVVVGTVLVVDPHPMAPGTPGLATLAASSAANRLGFRAEAVALTVDDRPEMTINGRQLDLAIIVVGNEPPGNFTNWTSSTWCVPGKLVDAFAAQGVEVLAVSAGAGAGALSDCFERGATVVLDLDKLPSELEQRLHALDDGDPANEMDAHAHPSHFESLLLLTASERRVLFYLTTGYSAQEIADNLVVSLTTVRSHIRSVLRKLGVRSQLAAVAFANSRSFECNQRLLDAGSPA